MEQIQPYVQELTRWCGLLSKSILPHSMSFVEIDALMQVHLVPWLAVGLYVPFVLLAPSILSPFYKLTVYQLFVRYILKPINFLWNVFLSVFSAVMFYNGIKHAINYIFPHYNYNPAQIICDPSGIVQQQNTEFLYWMWLFATVSKLLELFDTVLLVLKNPTRKVEFLHWFHHTTVLLFCWYAIYYRYGAALSFMLMNAFIHTFMYMYYALTELGYRPTWGKLLTIGQITQMILGMIVVVTYAYQLYVADAKCPVREPHIIVTAALGMYFCYFMLFLNFFFRRYDKNNAKVRSTKVKGEATPVTPTDEQIKKSQ